MFFKNLQIYRLPAPWAMTAAALEQALAQHKFASATSMDMVSQGWAAPRGADQPLVHTVGGQFLLQLKTEKKLLPASVINQFTKIRAAEMEEAQGFALGKKAMKELKERVTDELLPRAFPLVSTTDVWIDPINGWLVVDAASPAKADEVIKLLLKSVDKLPLESLRVQRSPVGVMTEWLQADESPAGFTVDQDAIMRATGESKAQVAYKRHTLEADDIRRHIAAGKQCTRLAMTWNDKVSFVLDESLAIKSVKPLAVITEREISSRDDAERFDGDFMLMAGELSKLLADLVHALGGEATVDAPGVLTHPQAGAQQKAERAIRLTAEMYKTRDMHRAVLNDLYSETIQPVIERVREHMTENSLGAVEAALAMAKALPAGSQSQQLLLVAAIEIVEPTGSIEPAKGSEPMREQRAASTASEVPAGDGSATDPLYEQAVAVVRANQRASISLVQRHLRIGYNRASRLLEAMEGSVVGPIQSNGSREVLSAAMTTQATGEHLQPTAEGRRQGLRVHASRSD